MIHMTHTQINSILICKQTVRSLISRTTLLFGILVIFASSCAAQKDSSSEKRVKMSEQDSKAARAKLTWPPSLPDGKDIVTDKSNDFLVKPASLHLDANINIAKTAPTIDFLYFPGQTYPSQLWSVWGDGSTIGSKYYTSIGDHGHPHGDGQVYEYDSETKKIRMLMSTKQFLNQPGMLPAGMDYMPGKIHSRTDIGADGWVYFSTHRGSTNNNTTDARGYKGDNIYRVNPVTGKQEIVAYYPMPKHTIPAGVLDPKRLIYYGGTAQGNDSPDKGVWFIAYDVKNNKLLKKEAGGFERYAILAQSTGCVYWKGSLSETSLSENNKGAKGTVFSGKKYDPKTNEITECKEVPVVRAATKETKNGIVYGVSQGSGDIWAFDTKTEKTTILGPAMVGEHTYVTSIDIDPLTQRYIYYMPGAHGGSVKDGVPVVQYDIKTKTRKVIAFLDSFHTKKYGYTPDGTFGSDISPDGSILYISWNGQRVTNADGWDTAAMMAIHIPASERKP